MLSIIICSINSNLLERLKQNIADTINCSYEIVIIDNTSNKYSISQAYNLGARKAKFSHLLFLHEDVAFHTKDWGEALKVLLDKTEIGLVGVSGAVCKSRYPSTWSMIPTEFYRINAVQRWKDGKTTQHIQKEAEHRNFSEVSVVDGVFLAMRKDVWHDFPFNEQDLKGFHFYDMESSLLIGRRYTVVVTHDILLEHFSEGSINKKWIDESLKWHKRHKNSLPIVKKGLSKAEIKRVNHYVLTSFCFVLVKNREFKTVIQYWLKALSLKPFEKSNLDVLKYYLRSCLSVNK
ncbi:glycosyltransferase [Phaeodactylibacter luteus]|uniref:Streptomycin biosynthesis protein StrF domain-containing protein n=1 Tax=Phaeodactylibacter luteus TaxID=1564516 RepID=A0A5C6RPA1_9BACT|nr:glycosyltransferase [Phaeodactylibacter luteus]TXB63804.1 hypothetical protein FRY97_08285 [Phaeodactylibacter luteus]